MPVVEVHLIEGYSAQTRTRLCEGLTDAVRMVVPAPPEAVTVMIHDHDPHSYMRGRVHKSGAAALPDPVQIVRDYLAAMEARDLETARSMLGEGFAMTFPGAEPMTTLEQLIEWSKPRYNSIGKTYDSFDACMGSGGPTVYCHGTLHGEWPDGTKFDGIRFIDRFEITDGKITKQDVWNDIAEVRA